MTTVRIISIWGIVAILCAVAGGMLAGARNRDTSAWIAWCFLFPPALIVLLLLPSKRVATKRRTLDEEDATDAAS